MRSASKTILTASTLVLLILGQRFAQAKSPDWKSYAGRPETWYRSSEGLRIAKNVISHQTGLGDWPKNLDTATAPYQGDPAKRKGTFDNGATTNEVRFLARAFLATGQAEDRDAVIRAIDHILEAQYPTGGWPQSSPPGKQYHRHITFNDNTMVNLLELLHDVATSAAFRFVDAGRRAAASEAVAAGVACIVKCQVVVDGKKTVWCAQHDEVTLEPRPARSFELVGLSGSESARILDFLMTLDRPGPEVVEAIEAGVAWFDAVKLTGLREVQVEGDRVIVADPSAPPLWARFYEIGTNRPFFSGRDGVKTYDLARIDRERRNGYAWYGTWGATLPARHARWAARLGRLNARP
jgi:PelA/Pel-15E family pectate lyase